MKKHICDICHRVEAYCRYTIRKKWKLRRFDYDSQGGSNFTMDICDACFDAIVKRRRNET